MISKVGAQAYDIEKIIKEECVMSLTDNNGGNGLVMPVSPMYGNGGGFGGFGDDWGSLIVLFLIAAMFGGFGGGFGMGGFGGFGAGLGIDFPWLLNGQQSINTNTNNGFQNAMLNDGITSIRDGISNLQTQLCNTGSDIQMALCNGFAGVEQGANTRQMANMNQAFANQQAMSQGFFDLSRQQADCCCENRLAIANLNSTIAREACDTRANSTQNTQQLLNTINSGVQSIKDQLCQDKIDAKNDEISQLRQEVLYARGQASQIAQNSTIIDGIYNRLNQCPVGTVPVYGEQPIFTCNNNTGFGCGCGSF